jgi:hypothetical protein
VAATVLAIESLVFIGVHVKFREIAPIILSGGESQTPTDTHRLTGSQRGPRGQTPTDSPRWRLRRWGVWTLQGSVIVADHGCLETLGVWKPLETSALHVLLSLDHLAREPAKSGLPSGFGIHPSQVHWAVRCQSSSFKPGTRLNSAVLAVTSVRLAERA